MPTKKHPCIAITGANGFLGTALVKHFTQKGWQVLALVRDPSKYTTRGNITYVKYDISTTNDDLDLYGVDYLVHAAYIKFDAKHPNAMDENIDGAKRLLTVCRRAKVKHALFISTMSAHKGAISAYGQQKLAIEKLFNQSSDIIFRCGLIIGNGGIVKQMSDFMKSKHAVPLIGGGKQPLQIVSVQDLTQAIETALQKSASGIYIIATPQVYTYKEFYRALALQLDTWIVYVPLPYWVLQAVFRVAAKLHLPMGVGEDNLKGLKMLRTMDTAPDLKRLGIKLLELDPALRVIDK